MADSKVDVVKANVDVSKIASWTDAVQALDSTAGIASISGLEEWGPVVKDKDSLIDVEFLIVEWKFHQGNFGEYAAALILTPDNEKHVLTDGSSGIYAQLKQLTAETGRTQGLHAKKGLRRSDYEINGKPASTYYLAG